jgi:hypothetical protein
LGGQWEGRDSRERRCVEVWQTAASVLCNKCPLSPHTRAHNNTRGKERKARKEKLCVCGWWMGCHTLDRHLFLALFSLSFSPESVSMGT